MSNPNFPLLLHYQNEVKKMKILMRKSDNAESTSSTEKKTKMLFDQTKIQKLEEDRNK